MQQFGASSFFGEDEPQLRTCARDGDVKVAPIVTVDGKSVPVTDVETPLLNIDLPKDNIFGKPAAQARVAELNAHRHSHTTDPAEQRKRGQRSLADWLASQ